MQEQEASLSALSSFVEAVNFCEKVLNIPHVATTITPKAMNICELANSRRREKRQARVLSVAEVASLEDFLSNERNLIVDRLRVVSFSHFTLEADGLTFVVCIATRQIYLK